MRDLTVDLRLLRRSLAHMEAEVDRLRRRHRIGQVKRDEMRYADLCLDGMRQLLADLEAIAKREDAEPATPLRPASVRRARAMTNASRA